MGDGAQRHMDRALAELGWTIAWGKPMPLITLAAGSSPTMWSAHAGGCAIAVRSGTPLRSIPATTDAVKRLWEAGRWCHATIHWGNWRYFLHVASLYAPVDDAQAADAALFAALVELAALGEVPILLAGDFNLEPQNSPTLHAACTNGGWHDIADLFARQNGAPAASTCTARPGAHPRRIDYMLANTVMFGACTEFSVLENTGLPTTSLSRCCCPWTPSPAVTYDPGAHWPSLPWRDLRSPRCRRTSGALYPRPGRQP